VRRRPLALVALLASAVALTACNSGGATGTQAVRAATSPTAEASASAAAVPTQTASASATPTATPSATPSRKPTPPPPPPFDVVAVQKRLTELKYYGGPADGRTGAVLSEAVMAFQKVQGLPIDGSVGAQVLAALAAPKPAVLKASAPADRVEVDLTKQVLYVVKGGAITRILPVSSGSGATYRNKDGSTATALTPVGWYTIQRRYSGAQVAPLGTLYDPQYFYQGWAIHGSNSVPAGPASHGCVRVTRWDGTWLWSQIGVGTQVYLYGGSHTFTAGSKAAGTSAPAGDDAGTAPAPAPAPAAKATTAPAVTATATPSTTATH
jgi:peptidoglycan hydrolase-like protein with peptidoglycan-binding domain